MGTEKTRDIIVIGGGAAGLSAAQYAARAGRSVVVIEEMAAGGQITTVDQVENYPGQAGALSGFELGELFEKQAVRFGAEVLYSTVNSLSKKDERFYVETQDGTWSAPAVILATGAKHRVLGTPGEDTFTGRGVSYCATCDGPFFRGRKILVIGGGDSALTEALFLAKLTDKVVLIHRKDRFRAQQNLVDMVTASPHIEVRYSHVVEKMNGDTKLTSVTFRDSSTGKVYEEPFDAVFIFVGIIPRTDLVPGVEKDDSGYIITNEKMETSMRGLYAAGDVRNTTFRQVITAASDGAVAAHWASEYIDEVNGHSYP
ncbi:thioredoxin-disulfide reductase [Parasphaerochaeta coccoides]|uniref:Thioredoxin reductase n=1 Tax=Parasphaerochaeta coccoides (strain ATCC BAA-1237 / DSM 17374 / SPN1) TaxID=760011 RepID=F4GIM4_PARC1|nr:thioredoxin-disulfide reductase [Parasphaerochaeta coccoides]AEC02158.1 thioredoxin reductase (NADPH) [Parasphaerochaeta coccoides DSM 17374]